MSSLQALDIFTKRRNIYKYRKKVIKNTFDKLLNYTLKHVSFSWVNSHIDIASSERVLAKLETLEDK